MCWGGSKAEWMISRAKMGEKWCGADAEKGSLRGF